MASGSDWAAAAFGGYQEKNGGAKDRRSKYSTDNPIPAIIQAKVAKVKELTKKSQFGELQGDIKVTKDDNGNYNLSYTQVKYYDKLKSDTTGVGDIPARKETTNTTYVLNSEGKRINTIRTTDTIYKPTTSNRQSDWTGANANRGTSRAATRKMSAAMKWADYQMKRK